MERLGYIYKIINKINNKIYIGQTSRDPEIRFEEHLWETRGHSRLHNAIQKYGKTAFKYEVIEHIPINQLDEHEKYWIKYYNTTDSNIGYNICYGGNNTRGWYNHILIEENNIIIDSKEELSRKLEDVTSWKQHTISTLLKRAIESHNDFLGYHIKYINCAESDISDDDVIVDWIKTLNVQYCGKSIFSPELNMVFPTIGQAAKYCIDNNYYIGNFSQPIQALRGEIGYYLSGKINQLHSLNNITFEEIPGLGEKNNGGDNLFKSKPIICIELNKQFNSGVEAAHYFIDNNIWSGIKFKTAKLRISDVLCGVYPHYRNYHFKYVE